jgi:hypothetical protein
VQKVVPFLEHPLSSNGLGPRRERWTRQWHWLEAIAVDMTTFCHCSTQQSYNIKIR